MRQAGAGGEKGAVEVDGEHRLPVPKGKALDGIDDLYPGVGDQHIDAAPGIDHLRHACIHLILAGDIHRHGQRPARRDGVERCRCRLCRRAIAIGDDHTRALGVIAPGDAKADAAGRAGDDGDLVVEFHARCSPGWGMGR